MNTNRITRIRRAAEILREAGITIDKEQLGDAVSQTVNVKRRDIAKFTKWARSVWPDDRFVVGWTRRGTLVFHSEASLETLKRTAANARSHKNGKNGNGAKPVPAA